MSRTTLNKMPQSSNESDTTKNLSDALSIFCREVRNLLRSKSNCMIPFSKFVPAYHNHYGRQCCVYQFGCTKLIELLESIPHVVQIVGEGNNRYITLTHREQIKRFASDLIKVVKSQPGKILKLSQFAQAYEQVLGRTFRVQDYGTNNINVLLAEIWEGTINIMPIKRELVDSSIKKPLFVDQQPSNELPPISRSNGKQLASSSLESKGSSLSSNSSSSASCSRATILPVAPTHHLLAAPKSPSINATSPPPQQVVDARLSRSQHHHNNNGSINKHLPLDSVSSSSTLASSSASTSSSSYEAGSVTILNQLVANCELVSKPYITDDYPDAWFEVPKRERSDKEIKRTKYFVRDVIELLSHMEPDYSVSFSKFIPSYHYYFNRQCKVSIFGFSKLIDLFESISPDVVEIIDQGPGQEKLIKLARLQLPFKMRRRLESAANYSNRAQPREQPNRATNCSAKQLPLATVKSEYQQSHVELEEEEELDEEEDGYDEDGDDNLVIGTGEQRDEKDQHQHQHHHNHNHQQRQQEQFEDDDEDFEGDDVLLPCTAIDNGPTEEELDELEHELKVYEELKAIQSKRSSRMAAILDIFKYTIY